MLFPTKTLVVAGLIAFTCSCASIFSRSTYPVTIDTEPRGAHITIYNRRGMEVFNGGTPALVKLKPGGGFFQKAIYDIEISKEGYVTKRIPISAKLNAWYFANILVGWFGVLGFLVIDPATGAMYRINDTAVMETLVAENKTAAAAAPQTPQLKIYDINEIPVAWKSKLVAIK
ncbi:hypothetical protein A4H97_19685 [Niastella yeongjuensis]|uniref:PEGA domain-containing protein n=1 Tax=Niastella yeongjuensis TaxID=354355 RepID=A0A1V9FBU3_9BACT|nr:hypothetical protein [Niastella yeongjuensis]OQP55824.1 hypothetical protein A4H97_19685 [Niastella yeongjuensis]SEP47465.1 hypothetical protein SAMN05660816_06610 [Niastella yeongjuensis]